jgi:hypothetical protein
MVEYFYEGQLLKLASCHQKDHFFTNHIFEVKKVMFNEKIGVEEIRVVRKTGDDPTKQVFRTDKIQFIEQTDEDIINWKTD